MFALLNLGGVAESLALLERRICFTESWRRSREPPSVLRDMFALLNPGGVTESLALF